MAEFELPERPEGEPAENPLILPVSVTISTLAVLVALVTMFGHRAANEQILSQAKASDQWSYYQAKNIRWHEMQANADEADKDEISNEAKKLEAERDVYGQRENRYDAGEALLEIGLVICSMTLLTKKKFFWFSGMAIAAVGVAIAVTGFLLH